MTGAPLSLGGEHVLGTFVKLPVVETVELMRLAGFDLVVVDLEHAPISIESAATMLAMARAYGMGSMVRIPSHGYEWIQRVLDAGAGGVLVPHVDSGAQAREIVGAARFAPVGTRGVGPTTRAGDWMLRPMADYLSAGDRCPVVAQIESRAAVDDIEAILDAGVSSVFVGPVDLACEMGVSGDSPELASAQSAVVAAATRRGVPCGVAAGRPEAAARLRAEGFSYVLLGNDLTMLGTAATAAAKAFREA